MTVASSLALLSLVLPPVSIISSATVSLVTLRRGAYEGFYVLVCACFSAALLGFFLVGDFRFALLYGLVLWLPVWLISVVLREGRHLSIAIEIAIILGIVVVLGFYIYAGGEPAALWQDALEQAIQPMLASNADMPVAMDEVKHSIQVFSHYMTGGFVAGTIYGLLFGLFLARMWQSALYNPGGFMEEYLGLRAHPKLALLSIVTLVVAWLMSGIAAEIAWNIAILFVVLYTFIGTAIVHTAFLTMKFKRFLVPMLYLTLIIIPYALAGIIVLGAADAWLDFRTRLAHKNQN